MKLVWRGPMYHGTASMHHYIEHGTVLGRVMAAGTPTEEQFAGWLSFKAQFFDCIEAHVPAACRRAAAYRADLEAMGLPESNLTGSKAHVDWVRERGLSEVERERRLTGTAYVCVGSVFGAEQIRKRLCEAGRDYPMSSLRFNDQQTEVAFLRQLRHRGDCIYEAMITFDRMVQCCEQIASQTATQEIKT